MSADWREAARGIPVWEGARLVGGARVMSAGHETDPPGIPDVWVWGRGGMQRIRPDDVPDLADPDTRAAYDRRLALALGAPAEAVDDGVCVHRRWDGAMVVTAGAPSGSRLGRRWAWASEIDMPEDPDGRLLARALAYPADKRVKP